MKTTTTDARYGTKAYRTEWQSRIPPLKSMPVSTLLGLPVSPKGKEIFTVMESAVCRILVCFVYSLFLLFDPLLPPPSSRAFSESAAAMLKGIARPYLRWKLGIFSLLTLYPVRYSTHEGREGEGTEGERAEGRWRGKATKTCPRVWAGPLDRHVSEWASFKTFRAREKLGWKSFQALWFYHFPPSCQEVIG